MGQAVKQQDAIRTLQNHYDHRTTSGQRAAEGQAHVFQLDLLFIAIPLVPNNISHAAAKRLLIILKHSVVPYLGFPFPHTLTAFGKSRVDDPR